MSPYASAGARGYNHNIAHRGVLFHVQTELSAGASRRADTHVFVGGRIVASRCRSFVDGGEASEDVGRGMRAQHRDVLRALIADRLPIPDELYVAERAVEAPRSVPRQPAPGGLEAGSRPAALSAERALFELGTCVRQSLARFREIIDEESRTPDLRRLGVAIAVLLGEEIESFVDDAMMVQLRACQAGIIETLRRSGACDGDLRRQLVTLGRGLTALESAA